MQRGEFFVFEHQLDKIGGISDFSQNMMMPNTSFILMNSDKLRDEYLKKHLDIITKNMMRFLNGYGYWQTKGLWDIV